MKARDAVTSLVERRWREDERDAEIGGSQTIPVARKIAEWML